VFGRLFFLLIVLFGFKNAMSFAQSGIQDSEVIQSFNRQDIVSLNFQNLADVINYVPLFNSQFKNNRVEVVNGVASNGNIGIFLNGVFLFQDEPFSNHLEMVAVNHLERIEIKKGSLVNDVKRNSPISIFLYSRQIDKDAGAVKGFISSSANNDVQTGGLFTISNYKHSLQLHAVRNFRNGYRFNSGQRAHDWSPNRNADIGLTYKFRIIESSWVEISLNHRDFKQQFKNELIPNTERVIDQRLSNRFTHFNLSFITPLSKNQTLKIFYQNQWSNFRNDFISKDLFHQQSVNLPLRNVADSARLNQMRTGFRLMSENEDLKIATTLHGEYARIQELNFPTLISIYTGYRDFTIGGTATYYAIPNTEITAGINYLSNDKLGWFFLPNINITYVADDNLTLSASLRDAIDYPSIFLGDNECCSHQLFLSYTRLFSAGRNRLFDLSFTFGEKNFSVQSGMMFYNRTNFAVPDFFENNNLFNSDGISSSMHTYIFPSFSYKGFELQSALVVNGITPLRSQVNQMFFYTESNWQMRYSIKKGITHLILNYRRIGSRTFTELEGNQIVLRRINPIQLITSGITQSFFSEKIHLTVGVENINNYTAIEMDGYIVGESEVYRPMGNLIFNRGRNFFIKLTFGEL
jgi:hypothetical protein